MHNTYFRCDDESQNKRLHYSKSLQPLLILPLYPPLSMLLTHSGCLIPNLTTSAEIPPLTAAIPSILCDWRPSWTYSPPFFAATRLYAAIIPSSKACETPKNFSDGACMIEVLEMMPVKTCLVYGKDLLLPCARQCREPWAELPPWQIRDGEEKHPSIRRKPLLISWEPQDRLRPPLHEKGHCKWKSYHRLQYEYVSISTVPYLLNDRCVLNYAPQDKESEKTIGQIYFFNWGD